MLPTRNHKAIRRWAEANNGVPAEVIPFIFDGKPTILHFLFGDAKKGTPELRPITWEDFFARFDLRDLSVVFDSDTTRFDFVRVEKPAQPEATN